MATGGVPPPDDNDGNNYERRPPVYRHVSTVEDVSSQTQGLVTCVMADCLRRDRRPVPPELSVQQQHVNREVAHLIQQVGDELENNYSLNSMIGQISVSPSTAFDTFASVAAQIFEDGVYNWGRIVTLFYFGYKLAIRVLNEVPLIKLIIEWVTRFIKERLAEWISDHGGWEGIKDWVLSGIGPSTSQFLGVLLAGIAAWLLIGFSKPSS